MTTSHHSVSADEVRALWDSKAAFWDERFGEGNLWHKQLLEPGMDRLIDVRKGDVVLDIATGNGAYARHLAQQGATVVAFDFSPVFVERARARTTTDRISYSVVDATDPGALRSLGIGRFDAAVATMALMDMPDIEPLAATLPELLKYGGRFVFSVQHPCFNSNAVQIVGEIGQVGEEITSVHGIKVIGYLDVPAGKGGGMPGEPNPHYYFHRPLNVLLKPFLARGFVLTALEEPTFAERGAPLTWGAVAGQIPPALIVRLEHRR